MMYKKYRYLITIIVAVVLFLPLQSALALEVTYPVLPGGYQITPGSSFGQYVQYIFVLMVLLGGIIGVISIVISGFQILLYAGSPAARTAALERIRGSVLGIILLMLSVIILRTINPT